MKNKFVGAFVLLFLLSLGACSNSSNKQGAEDQEAVQVEKSSGEDLALVYQISYKEQDGMKPAGSIKLYFSDGAVRSEVDMKIQGLDMKMTMLGNADHPEETVMLNVEEKTYSKMDLGKITENEAVKKMQDMQKDSVVILGEEEVNGYACTRVKVVTTVEISPELSDIIGDQGKTVTEYWLTKDIPGYDKYEELLESRPELLNKGSAEIYQYGMPVKQVTLESGEINMIMELKSLEQETIPASKFEVPDDYKEI